MSLKLLKGYLLAAVFLLILAAAAFVVVNNLGDQWTAHVFYRRVTLSISVWLLVAGACGIVVYLAFRRLLPGAVANLREGAHMRRTKQAAQSLKNIENRKRR